MASIQTQVAVYLGTTSAGTQVGNTITKSGEPEYVNLNSTELGVALSPGTQYHVEARVQSQDEVWSNWVGRDFQTKILAVLNRAITGCGASIYVNGTLTYDTNNPNISVDECGVCISTNASGAGAVDYPISEADFTDSGQDAAITGLNENTTYYVVPYVENQDGVRYQDEWSNAITVTTLYNAPTVELSQPTATYNSISGSVLVSTHDASVTNTRVTIQQAIGGGTSWTKLLQDITTLQNFTLVDGQSMDYPSGSQLVIQDNTQYRITVYSTNGQTGGCEGHDSKVVTTPQAQGQTIYIQEIVNIEPTSATVHLLYGDGGNGGE